MSMVCPHCKANLNSHVTDSRDHGEWLRRRRTCFGCLRSHTTYETVSETRQVGPPSPPLPWAKARTIAKLAQAILAETKGEEVGLDSEQQKALQHEL